MHHTKTFRLIPLFLILLVTGCAPRWEITLLSSEQVPQTISYQDVHYYLEESSEKVNAVPLAHLLYDRGDILVDRIVFSMQDGSLETYDWETIAEQTTLSSSGTVTISGEEFRPKSIEIHRALYQNFPQYSILDIAPTMASALGLPVLLEASGASRFSGSAEYGVMILLDGVQYNKLMELIESGVLPFLEQHQADIQMGLTVYPPITTAATAALLTSTPPQVNGVLGYGYRSTESITLFDIAAEAGLSVIAVEGTSLPFNLSNADIILSGDRDGNGFSDDNVFQNSLKLIESGMPDLLYIHFHEIDDMGHSYGPESPEYKQALMNVDGYLSEIYTKLPNNTLLALFADHGMHTTSAGGNHGTLTSEDMIIPILFITK
jgi:predicted AlkP superfamily pyrophosphatase or phosphodiesterase